MKVKTSSTQTIKSGNYTVSKVKELSFFDLTGEKSRTIGSSNKQYHAELWISKDNQAEIYTMYGATGQNQTSDYRFYGSDIVEAEKEFDRIIKSKLKKGYVEVDVAQRAVGSAEAKQITKAVTLKNAEHLTGIVKSNLHQETQRVIASFMGATNQFVVQTLKCPLGQLTNSQIDLGRSILDKAKTVVNTTNRREDLLGLTNQFYAAIPHNLGGGARGQMTELLLDSIQKIATKEDDLDTLLDAKELNAVLSSSSKVDDQYNSLNTEFKYIEKSSELFDWISRMLVETRASNHNHLGKLKLLNAWGVSRKGERDKFLKVVSDLSSETKRSPLPDALKNLVPIRPDLDDSCKLYPKTNTLPLWHGTRTQNVTGILTKGLLIRPAGAIITGAMYGNSVYLAPQSTKSVNYTSLSSSYWAKGNDKVAYMMIADAALGNPLIASGPQQYTPNNIKPSHSVWAKGGRSGVINDEIMIYNTTQFNIRYLVEFSA